MNIRANEAPPEFEKERFTIFLYWVPAMDKSFTKSWGISIKIILSICIDFVAYLVERFISA